MFIDGVCFDMRIGKSIESVPVLVAIGVKKTGQKLVLGLQAGDKESASSWREFFKDLKNRGLAFQEVTLGIMDGLPGLERVFKEEFTNAKVQRCQVHVAKNVLAKVPKKLKKSGSRRYPVGERSSLSGKMPLYFYRCVFDFF